MKVKSRKQGWKKEMEKNQTDFAVLHSGLFPAYVVTLVGVCFSFPGMDFLLRARTAGVLMEGVRMERQWLIKAMPVPRGWPYQTKFTSSRVRKDSPLTSGTGTIYSHSLLSSPETRGDGGEEEKMRQGYRVWSEGEEDGGDWWGEDRPECLEVENTEINR